MWIKREKKFHPVFLKILCAIVDGMGSKNSREDGSARSITSTDKLQLIDMEAKLFLKTACDGTVFEDFCKLHAAGK